MQTCASCGYPGNPDSRTSCFKCGTELEPAESPVKSASGDDWIKGILDQLELVQDVENVAINWELLDPRVIAAVEQNPMSGLILPERLESRREEIIAQIKAELAEGLTQGESYTKMAKRLEGVLDGDATFAMQVARTEGHRASQEGRLAAFDRLKEQGGDIVMLWNAMLDERTRDTHGAMDGQKADEDGWFYSPAGGRAKCPGGFGIPEEDDGCRCVLTAIVEGFGPTVRRVKGVGIVPYLTYSEWKAKKIADGTWNPPEK